MFFLKKPNITYTHTPIMAELYTFWSLALLQSRRTLSYGARPWFTMKGLTCLVLPKGPDFFF